MTRTADTPTMKAEILFTFFVNALHVKFLSFFQILENLRGTNSDDENAIKNIDYYYYHDPQ